MSGFEALKAYVWAPERGLTREIDRQVASMVVRRGAYAGEQADALAVLAAATTHAVLDGHSCLEVSAWASQVRSALPEESVTLRVALDEWERRVLAHELGDAAVGEDGSQTCPLLQVGGRVYLHRLRGYELNVARRLMQLDGPRASGVTPAQIHGCHEYFAGTPYEEDWQQRAVYQALRRRLSVVTGGPGTGKTTVLSLILAWRYVEQPTLAVALCAPTGKAAQRMRDAVTGAIGGIRELPRREEVTAALMGLSGRTLHRLLGLNETSDAPRFHAGHPLPYDLVVVDECSMMSLQLFSQLLSALKPGAELLLLGDKDQLTSVDAGNIMAELYASFASRPVARGEYPAVTRLVRNHRSKANAALCAFVFRMAELSGPGGSEGLPWERLAEPGAPTADGWTGRCQLRPLPGKDEAAMEVELAEALRLLPPLAGDGELWRLWRRAASSLDAAYRLTEAFKVLCAVREGRYGVLTLNAILRRMLRFSQPYATGLPVIVTRNDEVTGLNNGDTGVCFGGRVHFPTERDGVYRSFVPAELPPHECAFAMTIHKSQGSGYDHVLMVLPDHFVPVLTRELVYTGMTRTKRNLTILAPESLLREAIDRPTLRWSGLQDELCPQKTQKAQKAQKSQK